MQEWAGFTDDDLRRLKGGGPSKRGGSAAKHGVSARPSSAETYGSVDMGKAAFVKTEKRSTNSMGRRMIQKSPSPSLSTEPLSPDQKLVLPKPASTSENSHGGHHSGQSTNCDSNTSPTGTRKSLPHPGGGGWQPEGKTGPYLSHGLQEGGDQDSIARTMENADDDKKSRDIDEEEDNRKLITDEQAIITHELCNLEKYQKQHKQIEESNKKKRELLSTAINQRQKMAKAETAKLITLQKELSRLDQLLTVDVSIIRDHIEQASRDYLDAQKRYDRAEREFIESKMDLHHKADAKEQLTEHLYTVIYQNEMRKAKKLGELMGQLEMETDDLAELSASEISMPHPSLLSPMQLPIGHIGPNQPSLKSPTSAEPSSPSTPDNVDVQPKDSDSKEELPQNSPVSPPGNSSETDATKTESTMVESPAASTHSASESDINSNKKHADGLDYPSDSPLAPDQPSDNNIVCDKVLTPGEKNVPSESGSSLCPDQGR